MLGSDFLKAQMARICWLDGYSEGLNGMLAVAFVIKHRQEVGWWNGNMAELLSHHYDYSATEPPTSLEIPNPNNYAVQQLLQDIDAIYGGFKQDTILVPQDPIAGYINHSPDGSAQKSVPLYYGKLHLPMRDWFLNSISRDTVNHKRIASVGMLTFFT